MFVKVFDVYRVRARPWDYTFVECDGSVGVMCAASLYAFFVCACVLSMVWMNHCLKENLN